MCDMVQMDPAGEGEVSSQHRIEVAQDRQSSDVQWPRTPLSALSLFNVKGKIHLQCVGETTAGSAEHLMENPVCDYVKHGASVHSSSSAYHHC